MIAFILSFMVIFIPIFIVMYGLSSWLRARLYKYVGSDMVWTAWVPFCSIPWFGMIDAVYQGNERSWLSYEVVKVIEIVDIVCWFMSFTPVIGWLFSLIFYITWIGLFILYLYCVFMLCDYIDYEPLIVVLISFIPIIGGMIANTVLYRQAVKSGQFE